MMMKISKLQGSLLIGAMFLASAVAIAQPQTRVSPISITTARFDEGHASIYYSSPSVKSPRSGEVREIWGGLVPYEQVWRTGANEATLLVTENDMQFGEDVTVPAGAYSVFTLPTEDTMTLIINKQVGQWGNRYDESQDLVRLPMTVEKGVDTVEQFTISLERKEGTKEGTLTMSWADQQFTTEFTYAK